MGLTDKQVAIIAVWAQDLGCLTAVRLFGSRWRGSHRPNSDVDLAITVAGDVEVPGWDVYVDCSDAWQSDLTSRLGLTAHLQLYEPDSDRVPFMSCEEGHALLWSQAADPARHG